MSKTRVAIISFLVITILFSFSGYKSGYSWGLYKGYEAGYLAGNSSFPRLELENVTFTRDGNTFFTSQMTITGEQHIIDIIKNLPNMDSIFNFK